MSKIMIIILLCSTFLLSASHAAESKDQQLKAWYNDPDWTKRPGDPFIWKTWTPPTLDENKPTWDELYNAENDEQRLKTWNNDNSWTNILTGINVTREHVNWNSIIWKLLNWKSPIEKPLMRKLSTRHPTARKSTTWRPPTRKTTTWRPPTRKTTTWRPPTWKPQTTTKRPLTWNPLTKKPSTWRPTNWNVKNTSGSDWTTFIVVFSIAVFIVIAMVLFVLVRRRVFSSCSLRNT